MGQLTLKILQSETNEALTDLEQRISNLEEFGEDSQRHDLDVAQRLEVLENPLVETFEFSDETWVLLDNDGNSLSLAHDEGPTVTLSAKNQLEIVEALIEALRGVRLMRAGDYANALQAKYFPPEEVEEEEVVA